MKFLKDLFSPTEETKKDVAKKEIDEFYNIKIKNGKIYALCYGNAVVTFDDKDRVSDIIAKVEEMKNSYISHRYSDKSA